MPRTVSFLLNTRIASSRSHINYDSCWNCGTVEQSRELAWHELQRHGASYWRSSSWSSIDPPSFRVKMFVRIWGRSPQVDYSSSVFVWAPGVWTTLWYSEPEESGNQEAKGWGKPRAGKRSPWLNGNCVHCIERHDIFKQYSKLKFCSSLYSLNISRRLRQCSLLLLYLRNQPRNRWAVVIYSDTLLTLYLQSHLSEKAFEVWWSHPFLWPMH